MKAKIIHSGHYTLGRRALCGTIVCAEVLTLDDDKVTCKRCLQQMA